MGVCSGCEIAHLMKLNRLYTWNAVAPILMKLNLSISADDKTLMVAGDEEVLPSDVKIHAFWVLPWMVTIVLLVRWHSKSLRISFPSWKTIHRTNRDHDRSHICLEIFRCPEGRPEEHNPKRTQAGGKVLMRLLNRRCLHPQFCERYEV